MTLKDQESSQPSSEDQGELDVSTTEETQPVQNDADSSETAKDDDSSKESPKDLLDVARNVLAESKKEESGQGSNDDESDASSTSESAEAETSKGGEVEVEAEGEITQEELNSYKPKTRRRVEQLLSERRQLTDEREALTPRAEQFDAIDRYMKKHDLTVDQVSEGFMIMAAMRSDPVKAREYLTSLVSDLDVSIGNKLPQDLQSRVDDGSMDEEAALEVSRSRAATEREKQLRLQAEQSTETVAQQRDESDQQKTQTILGQAVTSWENAKTTSDPDYALKQPLMINTIKAEVAQRGYPTTEQQALAMVESAYTQATSYVQKLRPKRQQQPKTVVTSRPHSGTEAPAPKSLEEVVKRAANGA